MKISYIDTINLATDDILNSDLEDQNISHLFQSCDIMVYGDEGNVIPHFHIVSKYDDLDFECCVCICEQCYFRHIAVFVLTGEQKIQLNTHLQQDSFDKNGSIWQFIVHEWNRLNPDNLIQLSEDTKQPDYTSIPTAIMCRKSIIIL